MSELTKRVLFAVPAAVFFLFVTWLGGFYFVGLIVLIAIFIQHELSALSAGAGFEPDQFFPYTIGLWILLSPFLVHQLAIGLAIFLLFVGIQVFKTGDRALKNLVSTVFCGIYPTLGLLGIILIRDISTDEYGFALTIGLLLMVWGNDVFAYFGGKNFGKRKLAPAISPNKTWEGFFFGIVGAFIGLTVAYYAVPVDSMVPLAMLIPATLLVSIFGPIGDLTESRIKRAANAKDSSSILPGHGGFFDRFDALILAAPAFYLYLYLLKVLGYVSF
ncbi:MAG: phosphatidate cytidylyltransferase [Bacteroidota bacterium]